MSDTPDKLWTRRIQIIAAILALLWGSYITGLARQAGGDRFTGSQAAALRAELVGRIERHEDAQRMHEATAGHAIILERVPEDLREMLTEILAAIDSRKP